MTLQPAISMQEFLPVVAASPSAWVGAAGGSPLKEQSQAETARTVADRSAYGVYSAYVLQGS